MKKSKLAVLLCAALVLGLVLCITGYSMGGSTYVYLSGRSIEVPGKDRTLDVTDVPAFTSLNVNTTEFHVTVEYGDSFHLNTHSRSGDDIKYSVDDGIMTVFSTNRDGRRINFGLMFADDVNRLSITLPRDGTYDNISVNSEAGRTDLQNLSCKQLSLISSTGDQFLYNINADDVTARASTGSVYLEKVVADQLSATASVGDIVLTDVSAKDLSLQSSTGSVRGDHLIFETLRAESDIGNVHLYNVMGSTGASITCHTGAIRVEGTLRGVNLLKNDIGDVFALLSDPKSSYRTDFHTDIGDVRVTPPEISTKENDPAPNALNIRTGTGSIEVTFDK